MDKEVQTGKDAEQELITTMIGKAKNNFGINGGWNLFWGWGILFCCVFQFIAVDIFGYANGYFIWFLTWVMVAVQVIMVRKGSRSMKTPTFAGQIIGYVWLLFFVGVILSVFICVETDNQRLIYPFILLWYSVPIFLGGIVLKFRPLVAGGICCWVLAFTSPFIGATYQLILIALAIVIAWIIPGYLLRKQSKRKPRLAGE